LQALGDAVLEVVTPLGIDGNHTQAQQMLVGSELAQWHPH